MTMLIRRVPLSPSASRVAGAAGKGSGCSRAFDPAWLWKMRFRFKPRQPPSRP